MALVEDVLSDQSVRSFAGLIKILIVCTVLATAAVVGGTASIKSSISILAIQIQNIENRLTRLEASADQE